MPSTWPCLHAEAPECAAVGNGSGSVAEPQRLRSARHQQVAAAGEDCAVAPVPGGFPPQLSQRSGVFDELTIVNYRSPAVDQ